MVLSKRFNYKSVQISEFHHKQLKHLSVDKKKTITEVLSEAVSRYLKKEGK